MQVRRHQQQFQRHRDQMGFRTSRWMPEKRRENVVQKMLVMKQMTQVVEVHSPIQDRQHDRAQAGGRGGHTAGAVALAEAYSSTSRQRAGALGLSAGVAIDLRLGWDLRQRADQVKAEKRLSVEKTHLLILSPMCLVFLSTATRQARRVGRTAGAGQTSSGVCMQSSKIANRARWTRSLRVSIGGVGGAVLVVAEVDRWHALCSMRPVSSWNEFG